jgi:coenzyme F420-0:L-glutamate ligase/coenzyme F420-1:gamma-L-glutamate ligase
MSLNLFDIIKNRRSVKEYSPKEVSKEVLFRILEAGTRAPSAHNAQPWRFIVIRNSALKQKLAEDMASRWDEDMSKNVVPKEHRESLI